MQLVSLYCLFGAASGALPHHHPQHSAPKELLQRIAKSNPSSLRGGEPDHIPAGSPGRRPFTAGMRVTPSSMGADPTGQRDSWAPLNAAIELCLNQSALSPNGFFPGQDTTPQFGPIRDAGGCDIDLEGGEYRISKPLHIPQMNANMQFGRGSLVADPAWDPGEQPNFLFIIGQKGGCRFPQGSCNIDINFPELFVDGAKRASGIQINDVMGVTIGPGGYFLNFTEFGLQINAGHEVMMDRCWLGETNFDYDHEKHGTQPNATAIQINGNDHYILNTIVFSAKIGLEVNGAADYITGVHVWFPVNHAVAFHDSIAFHITGSGNRLNGCYIDGGRAIFTQNALSRNIWTNGFECCQGAAPAPGTTASGILLVGEKVGPGLQIMNNEFGGGSIYHCSSVDYENNFQCTPPDYTLTEERSVRDCTKAFNVSSAGRDCQGLATPTDPAHAPGWADASEANCAQACCDDSLCSVYQYCPAGVKCVGLDPKQPATVGACFTGKLSGCGTDARHGWVGNGIGGLRPAGAVSISGVRIAHNSMSHGKGTQASLSLTQTAATTWSYDFCDSLIFPRIAVTKVHVSAAEGFPLAVARPTNNCTVMVETSTKVTGTITVEVDSSDPDPNFV